MQKQQQQQQNNKLLIARCRCRYFSKKNCFSDCGEGNCFASTVLCSLVLDLCCSSMTILVILVHSLYSQRQRGPTYKVQTLMPAHRRRIETEGKAKVVASVWGQNLLKSLPR